MTYGGVYAYVAASPLLLQRILGLPPSIYALAFLANSLGLVAGVQVAGRLSKRRDPATVLAGFITLTLLAAVGLLILHPIGLPAVLPCLWLFVAGCGGCFPGAVAGALRDQGLHAGTAASAYGFSTFASASLVAPLPGLFGVTDATSTALVLTATASVSLLTVAISLQAGRSRSTKEETSRTDAEAPATATPATAEQKDPEGGVDVRDADAGLVRVRAEESCG
jgi:DHA1 family bicyclomycin/chloramphenicol resistance-like MFS transporter